MPVNEHIVATKASFAGQIIDLNCLNYQKKTVRDGAERIAQFIDDIPSSINATQGVQTQQPVLTFNAINGHPAAFYDGSDDAMNLSSFLSITDDCTFFFVLYLPSPITAASPLQSLFARQVSTAPRGGVTCGFTLAVGETFTAYHTSQPTGLGNVSASYITSPIPAGFNIIELKLSGSTTTIKLNNVSQTVLAFNGGLDASHSLINIDRMFAHIIGFGGYYSGYGGRNLVFNTAFSSGDSALMYQRLLNTWT